MNSPQRLRKDPGQTSGSHKWSRNKLRRKGPRVDPKYRPDAAQRLTKKYSTLAFLACTPRTSWGAASNTCRPSRQQTQQNEPWSMMLDAGSEYKYLCIQNTEGLNVESLNSPTAVHQDLGLVIKQMAGHDSCACMCMCLCACACACALACLLERMRARVPRHMLPQPP